MANNVLFSNDIKNGKHPFLKTETSVYNGIKLDGYQSTLNYLVGFSGSISCSAGSKTEFIYKLGKNPGLQINN